MSDKSKYFAIIIIGAGGSWCYDATPKEAARRCAKLCKEDWGHMFNMDKGRELKVGIYDVGFLKNGAEIVSGEDGVFYRGPDDKPVRVERHSIETVIL